LADGACGFFKLVFLNSEEDRNRPAACREHQIVLLALSRLRKQAARRRADRMPASAIDAEIRAVRSRRKSA